MKKFFFALFVLIGISVYSQSPDWTVNVNSYQYSMTFTVFLNVNGTILTNTNDKVGAFVNGKVRGSANIQYNTNANKYIAYLTVLSNSNGETINFKIYDSTQDSIVDVATTESFVIDGNVGSVFQSFSIANPALKSTAKLSSFSFQGITSISNIISNNEVQIKVPSNTDTSSLTPVFNTADNAKVFVNRNQQTSGNSTLNFSNNLVLEVLSEDESNLQEYTVIVTKEVATTPPSIVLSSTSSTFVTLPVEVQLKASAEIIGLTIDDFTVSNCLVSKITPANTKNFTLTVVPLTQGNFTIAIAADKVLNDNNQGNLASNKLVLQVDTINPLLTKIQRKTPTSELTKATDVVFTVEFSENVKKVSASDFTSVDNSTISVVKVTDKVYEISVQGLSAYSGLVQLQLSQNNDIEDLFGNALQNTKFSSYEK